VKIIGYSGITGLLGSALERRDPRCLRFLVAVASTEFWHTQASTTTTASIVNQRSRSVIVLTTSLYHSLDYTGTTVYNQSANRQFHVSLRFELFGNLPLRNVAPTLPANKPRPQSQVRPRDCRSPAPPAIFIPSALCRLTFQLLDSFAARSTVPTYYYELVTGQYSDLKPYFYFDFE